jgi:pyridoxine/pyridoxamine 5'-phosphate oxidase
MNIIIEAVHALKIFLTWFRIEENEGVSKPNASFVVAVEPTTEPTSLIMLINAG